MEFSIQLAGWVLDDPIFHKKDMVLKRFILCLGPLRNCSQISVLIQTLHLWKENVMPQKIQNCSHGVLKWMTAS